MPAPSPVLLPASLGQVEPLVQMIVSGQLVVLPTETVYAIAVNLRNPDARQRLAQLKGWPQAGGGGGRPPVPWVLHLGEPTSIREWFYPDLFPMATRLIRRGLPGPIALELPVLSGDLERFQRFLGDVWPEVLHGGDAATGQAWATFRGPDQALTQAVLDGAWKRGVPVALVGASGSSGPAGQPQGRVLSGSGGVEEVLSLTPHLADHVAAILDAGPPRYHKPSTLVRVAPDRLQVLRPGVFDERIIQRLAQTLILFVCTGNTCRSPMAAALARPILAQRLGTTPAGLEKRNVLVESAGLHAYAGARATLEAQEAVKDVLGAQRNGGGELAAHAAQQISRELLQRADVIFTMTDAHREEILHFWPAAAAKTYRLDPAGDVEDPIGGDESLYRQVAERFEAVLRVRLNEIRL
ncbi:MAG: Sua5/YciO/YrdC/YwlC family protein [Phycisphaerae bacterium]